MLLAAIMAAIGLLPTISKITADLIGVAVTYVAFRFLVFVRDTSTS
jgi:hypothetical protein